MDNEFLSTPLLRQKKRQELANSLSKDQVIRGLEEKNNRLQKQIYQIEAVMKQTISSEGFKAEKPQRLSIMRTEENHSTITKELANAYKKIKMYEYEINKIEENQSNFSVIVKTKQLETVIKEKRIMCEKLKAKFLSEKKNLKQNSKKLNNNQMQVEVEKKIKNLGDQVKFYQQKQSEMNTKDSIKQANMKKQFQYIKKLENQLLQMGMSGGELDEIKQKALRSLKNQGTLNESKVQKFESSQNRTKDYYRVLKNEIKILDKIHVDHQKKIHELEQEKSAAMTKNRQTRSKILQIEDETEQLEKQISILKGKVVPSNMRPLQPLRSISSSYVYENKSKIKQKNISINKAKKSLNHLTKFDEVGMTSEKGQRFTDRNILGKANLHNKITGISVYLDKGKKLISGFQCTYDHKKKGGEYVRRDRDSRELQYHEEIFVCDEKDYLKSISGTLTSDDKLESISVLSKFGKSKKFGQSQTTRKAFTFDIGSDEIPVCLFGCLKIIKEIGKKEYSIVEHFGVQISKEEGKEGKQ